MIWEQAVRPEVPGVHFFTVHDAFEDTHLVQSPWSVKRFNYGSDDGLSESSFLGFAGPLCDPDGNISWTRWNPSTYMEDSALWTTCRDSRRYMLKRFRPAETSRRIVRSKTSQTHRQVSASGAATVTAALQTESGERQYFTIQPMKDLIIIQTPPSSCMSWNREFERKLYPEVDERWWSLPRSDLLSWRVPRCVVCAPRNIAIEFDAKWSYQFEEYGPHFEGVSSMEHVETVWFVDYRLQRAPQGAGAEESQHARADRKVFHAQDRRFVEVSPRDAEWIVCDVAGKECFGREAFEFVARLNYCRMGSYLEDDEENWIPRPVLKVLACEILYW